MSTFTDKLSGSLCFLTHFSVLDLAGINPVSADKTIAVIKKNLSTKYKKVHFDSTNCEVLENIKTAQTFLHQNGLPFMPERVVISDFTILHDTLPITGSTIMFTIFPEIGTASFSLNLHFEDASTNQIVFLRQCSKNTEKFKLLKQDGSVEHLSIKEIFNMLMETMAIPVDAINNTYLLELNKFGETENLQETIEQEAVRVYGLLTGDEGWPFVSKELAMQRISHNWGSRKFFNFIAFGSNFILFNLNHSKLEEQYEIHQKNFSTAYYGNMNPYFTLKSSFAGVNHGILFSIETVMAIKTITKYILDKQTFFKAYQIENFNTAIQRTKSYRKDLMLTLNKLEQLDITELGELESLVLKSQNIDPIIEKIKYLLELLESDLTLMYSQQTNKMVNFLTIFGLILSIIGTVVAILDWIG